MDFGTWIKASRTEHECTQAECAVALNVSQPTVSLWERNVSIPTMRQASELEEFFGVEMPLSTRESLRLKNSLPDILIRFNLPATPELCEQIATAYDEAAAEIGEAELAYVDASIVPKLKVARESATAWVRELGEAAALLHELYLAQRDGSVQLPTAVFSRLVAALFYFVNPWDVIPDTTLGTGYLDDAIVLNECVCILVNEAPTLVAPYLLRPASDSS